MKLIHLLLLFPFLSYGKHNLTVILVAAPKKVPMLTYTIEYFLNAYNYDHEDINVDNFYLIKGIESKYEEHEYNVNLLKAAGINVLSDNLIHDFHMGTEYYEKIFLDYYLMFCGEFEGTHARTYSFEEAFKENIVNYYVYQIMEKVKKYQGVPDNVLFLEDDVAMPKTMFSKISKYLDKKGKEYVSTKLASQPSFRNPHDGDAYTQNGCPWGYWGLLLRKDQYIAWEKFSKVIPYGYCGDTFHCRIRDLFSRKIRMEEIFYHFGRDKNIKPRNPKYWNN